MEFTAQQIADFTNGIVAGNPAATVNDFSKIEDGKPGTLTFLANKKYEHFIYRTKASIVLVNDDFIPAMPVEATLIKVPNAYTSLAMLLDLVEQSKVKKNGINASAFIAENATVGDDCYIGSFAYIGENSIVGKQCKIYPHVYIGDRVTVGDNTILYPHTVVYHDCSIGSNCIIHAGAVIGADGFGFAPENGQYKKIAQIGNVVIEDDVEIGANTTIDRSVMGATLIHKGVKLDNLIHIAHNVEVGYHTAMAAQTGIAGSAKIGDNCMIGGQVGVVGHLQIGDHAQIGPQSGIMNSVEANARMMGSPATTLRNHLRSTVIFQKLPELYKTINKLERDIEELKKNKQV